MRRRAVLSALAFFTASLPFGSPVMADGPHLTGPIVHANLAIYLVHGAAAEGPVPLTLQEALAKGTVKVHETGSVNELTVENVGKDEVFVQAGDIVKGGQQDRVLSVDLLLPPQSGQVSIAAFCVEQGRWSARGKEDARQFSSAGAAMPSRKAKVAMRRFAAANPAAEPPSPSAAPAMAFARHAGTGESQREIWDTVKKTQDQLTRSVGGPVAASASPSSLQLSLESEKLKQAQAAYIKALRSAGEAGDDIVGYVFAINGKINSGDVYASNALFRKMWPKLLAANVTEAIGDKHAAGAAPPSIGDVEAFLAATQSVTEAERPINAAVRLATRDGDTSLFAETRRSSGGWVHRNYLVK